MGWFGGSCTCCQTDNCGIPNPLSVVSLNEGFASDCLSDDGVHGWDDVDPGRSICRNSWGVDQNNVDLVDCYDGVLTTAIDGEDDSGPILSRAFMHLGRWRHKFAIQNGTLEAGTLDAVGSVKLGTERLGSQTEISNFFGDTWASEIDLNIVVAGVTLNITSEVTGSISNLDTLYTTTLRVIPNGYSLLTKTHTTPLSHYKNAMPTMSWSIQQTSLPYLDLGNNVADFDIELVGGGTTYTLSDVRTRINWCNHANEVSFEFEDGMSVLSPLSTEVTGGRGISLVDARVIGAADTDFHFYYPKADDFVITVS